MFKTFQKTIALNDGRSIVLETGKLAKQADGAVVVRLGDTMLLATVVTAAEGAENSDYMPLQVEYREKFSAIGRYRKKSSRPSRFNLSKKSAQIKRNLTPIFK